MSDYFNALERELVDAAGRKAHPAPKRRWLGRPALAVLVALAIGVPATAAVQEAFTPVREPDGLVRLSRDTVVARGTLPVNGRWELVASDSDVGKCLGIRFLDDQQAPALAGGCGPPPGSRLVVGSTGGGDRRLPYVFSGVAPVQAQTVEVVDRRGRVIGRTSTQPGPASHQGAYFAVETTVKRPRGCLRALGADGAVLEAVDTARLAGGCGRSNRNE